MLLYIYCIKNNVVRGVAAFVEFVFLSYAVMLLPLSYALQFISISSFGVHCIIFLSLIIIAIERGVSCANYNINTKMKEGISRHKTLIKAIWSNLVFSLILDICIIILTVSSHIFGHWTLVTCGLLSGSWVTVAAICNILDTAAIRNIKNNDRNRI